MPELLPAAKDAWDRPPALLSKPHKTKASARYYMYENYDPKEEG